MFVDGAGTAGVSIGNAQNATGTLSAAGSTYQIDDAYQGSVVANLEGAIIGGTKVDTSATTTGGGTIASNAGLISSDTTFEYYVNTGAANDQISGSKGNDIVRAGAGDDIVNTGAGNDIVRLGSGNDTATLGAGNDTAYFTVDQLQGTQTKTITDFDASGNDKIQIEKSLEGLTDIEGIGSKSITISLSGAQTGTTTIVSQGENIDDDDIEFV